SKERITLLEKIGFQWATPKGQENWDDRFVSKGCSQTNKPDFIRWPSLFVFDVSNCFITFTSERTSRVQGKEWPLQRSNKI
ncbi:hypothetical protein ACHAXS_001963, partial [Conticribra weissflogii]